MTELANLHRTAWAGAVAIAAALGAPAMAQNTGASGDEAGMSGRQMSDGGLRPETLTCEGLRAMNSGVAQGTLYFIAGYQRGSADGGLTGREGQGATRMSADAAENETTMGNVSDTAGSLDGDADPASTGEPEEATASATRLAGFYEIPVTPILETCTDTPDRMVIEVLEEHRRMSDGDGIYGDSEN